MARFLFVTTVPVTLRSFLLPLAHHFRAQGHRVDALAQGITACDQCRDAFDAVHEVPWSRRPWDWTNHYAAPRVVRDVVRQGRYDLVHVHTPVASFVTRQALRKLRREPAGPKVIYTAHGFHFYRGGSRIRNAIFLALEKLAGRWTDQLIVINQEDFDAARHYAIVPDSALHYMPGIGVDTEELHPAAVPEADLHRVRSELGRGPSQPLILMVAEFIPRKHHADALQALARSGKPNLHLALAGTGPLLETMRKLAVDLGISERVHFLGYRRDVPALMRASAATLLPSAQEGLPRSILESLSLGVPVIGSRIRGTQDLLTGGAGMLVKLGDIAGLAQAMAWLVDHPQVAVAMGQRGREQAAASDLRRIIQLHESLYAAALGEERIDGVRGKSTCPILPRLPPRGTTLPQRR